VIDFRRPLLDALSHGPKRPSDLDEELLGSTQWHCIQGILPVYGGTLGDLVDEKIVKWWRDSEDIVWYAMNYTPEK